MANASFLPETMMRFVARLLYLPVATLLLGTVAACGGDDANQTAAVQMSNMEAVDGTTNDAMTDLDGVQSEGTAMAASDNAAAPAATANNAAAAEDARAEVVADQ